MEEIVSRKVRWGGGVKLGCWGKGARRVMLSWCRRKVVGKRGKKGHEKKSQKNPLDQRKRKWSPGENAGVRGERPREPEKKEGD